MKFIVKVHKAEGRVVLAVCDEEIFGKTFFEGEKQIDLSSEFYKGRERDESEILNLMKSSNSINLVGKNIIALAIKNNFVNKENVIKIDDIPIAFVINEPHN